MVRRLSGSRPHGALSLDGDGMQGMPAAGLIGLPVVTPCFGAGMSSYSYWIFNIFKSTYRKYLNCSFK